MTTTPPTARRHLSLWTTWACIVTAVTAFTVWALHVLVDAPHRMGLWWLAGAIAFLVPIVAMFSERTRRVAGVVLRVTVTVGGLLTMVLAVYIVVVVGLGEDVNGTEHRVLGLSMVSGAAAVALAGPVRSRLRAATRATRNGTRPPADKALQNFGARMTRAVPMDELLLQLAETLYETMAPEGAEVWTGAGGTLERSTSVPDRGTSRTSLSGAELSAVTGARVSGRSWASVWIPQVLESYSDDVHVRIAPITHLGQLLGFVVVARPQPTGPFTTEDDALLADVARQVGLALHNVRLDSALKDSLEELQRKNRMLQDSQSRIVTAANESRRQIERDLHDGAQQQLVALAVKLQIARLKADDPEALTALLEDLGTQVKQTIDELRELAHGIYPPLLRDSGLGDALKTAIDRAPVPGSADIALDRRFDEGIEAAVYFCCLEAMQNAAKYAGPDATVTIRVSDVGDRLSFEVEDDGAGFDAAAVSESHGFVNMRDRLGAHGGELSVDSSLGGGTVVRGWVPVD